MNKDDIIHSLLQECIDYINNNYVLSDNYEQLSFALRSLEEISEISLLFSYESIFDQANKIYDQILTSNKFNKSILKFQLQYRNNIIKSFTRKLSRDEIKEKYPTITKEDIFKNMRKINENHIILTLNNKYKEALANETKQVYIEEIALTLIVMNKFEDAEYIYSNFVTESYRNDNKYLLYVIEHSRINNWEKAKEILNYLPPIANSLGIYERLHLVKGLKELEPWLLYPYPDY